MHDSTRRYFCAGCRKEVFICTSCDRGQQYCASGCARAARCQSREEAKRRYESSHRGRLKHAERSQRYRDRRKRVTDHGSLFAAEHDVLSASAANVVVPSLANEPATPAAEQISDERRMQCHFCHCWCSSWVRHAPLRRRSRRFEHRRER